MRTSTSTAVAIAVETATVTSAPTTIVLKAESMTSNAVWDVSLVTRNLAGTGRVFIGNVGLGNLANVSLEF